MLGFGLGALNRRRLSVFAGWAASEALFVSSAVLVGRVFVAGLLPKAQLAFECPAQWLHLLSGFVQAIARIEKFSLAGIKTRGASLLEDFDPILDDFGALQLFGLTRFGCAW